MALSIKEPDQVLSLWNWQFEAKEGRIQKYKEPQKSYAIRAFGAMKKALIDFLHGERDAFDRFKNDFPKILLEDVSHFPPDPYQFLGMPISGGILFPESESITDFKSAERYIRETCHSILSELARNRDFSRLDICPQCGTLFLRTDKRQKFCDTVCRERWNQPKDDEPYRKAYRRVYMQFRRLLDMHPREKAIEILLETPRYAELINEHKILVENWKGDDDVT